MNKVIWWIIGIVIVVGLIYYVSAEDPVDTGNTEDEAVGSLDQGSNEQRSLVELLAAGTAQKCTFDHSVDGSTNEGRIYIGNGKMRGDFSSTVNGQTMMAHMISDGQEVNTWVDGM